MIPAELIAAVEQVRTRFLKAMALMDQSASFQALARSSAPLRDRYEGARRIAAHPRLRRPCDGRIVCAFIGASGHGKTTLLDELFPDLARRGWLVTEKNDTTAQSLRIEYAAGPPELDRVTVHSWSLDQIKLLAGSPEAKAQNELDHIRVHYLDHEGAVVVDGSEAGIPKADLGQFRFGRRLELRPLPVPYVVPTDRLGDRAFIRALTIKEQSSFLSDGPILTVEGRSFNPLQLRAVVKDVTLHDPFERIASLSGRPVAAVKDLVVTDTPGLATASSLKDEVLRHCLEQKSNRIVIELWKDDELDLIVHVVLCGEQSNFASLWKAVEAECGPDAVQGLEERLILVVNGTSLYFSNPDLNKKFKYPVIARAEGDHLATTLVDNILQKMSPRGGVRPAKICFVDSQRIVEGGYFTTSYARQYAGYRDLMRKWATPGGVGFETLRALDLVDDFRANIDALCDPEDRGQGFLVRQVLELAQARGPALLLRKYLVRTGLLAGLRDLRGALGRYYGADGTLGREAVEESLRRCLQFLDPEDPRSIEAFAQEEVDPKIELLLAGRNGSRFGDDWVAWSFRQMAGLVHQGILRRAQATPEVAAGFGDYYHDLVETWAERWGYTRAKLKKPSKAVTTTGELIKHCLKVHCREIVYQLGVESRLGVGAAAVRQDESDRRRMREALELLDQAARQAEDCCTRARVTC